MKTLFVAAAMSVVAFGQAAALPTGESLFDKYVEVTGGKAAYAKRTSEVTKGTIQMPAAGVSGTLEIYWAAPNVRVALMDVQGVGKVEEGTNGVEAWEVSAVMGPKLKDGKEKAQAIREALFNMPIYWRKLYSKAQTTGVETVEGIECYRVVATPTDGSKVETFWFDKTTGYNVKVSRTVLAMGSEIPAEIVMKDYQKSGFVIQPMTMIQRVGGQEVILKLTTVTANAPIPKTRFAPPPDIQQLMKKAA
ncbi:hypothetical protein F183_A20900 [Bryobacterales bacterium F-183]|nr:hypothetical protein F183_A20900 [Bryobacterales bacterium F-183]